MALPVLRSYHCRLWLWMRAVSSSSARTEAQEVGKVGHCGVHPSEDRVLARGGSRQRRQPDRRSSPGGISGRSTRRGRGGPCRSRWRRHSRVLRQGPVVDVRPVLRGLGRRRCKGCDAASTPPGARSGRCVLLRRWRTSERGERPACLNSRAATGLNHMPVGVQTGASMRRHWKVHSS
jgi:hypothetical protein